VVVRPSHRARWLAALALGTGILLVVLGIAGLKRRQHAQRGASGEAKRAAPALRAVQLTRLGTCELGPLFLDARTLAFELDRDGDAHIFSLSLDQPAALSQLTSGALLEQGVGPGRRVGEILYRIEDPRAQARLGASQLALQDLATGARTTLEVSTSAATAVGADLYYARTDHDEIRRLRGQLDEAFLEMPPDLPVGQLLASPTGDQLAILADVAHGAPRICLVGLDGPPRLRCPDGPRPIRGRIAFSADGHNLYYPASDGLHRFQLKSGEDLLVLAGVFARGGLAISPAGDALVFSDCRPRGPLLDVTQSPPRIVLDDDLPREPAAGPNGALAYVRERNGRRQLVVRSRQGIARELTSPEQGSPSAPAFDASGRWLAFQLVGIERPGIYVIDAAGGYPPEPLTRGPHDTDPVWTADGRVAFTRRDPQHHPWVYLVPRQGGEPERAPLPSRQTVQRVERTGELLLSSNDKRELFLWQPSTGGERRISLGALEGSYLMSAAISVDGSYLIAQVGTSGRSVWKVALGAPQRAPTLLFEGRANQTMSSVALTGDGQILVGARAWRGELFVVRAPAGWRF
jgi:Tol biopolymer transport system component